MTRIDDIVNRITAAIACGQCGNELPAKGASDDFCSWTCQEDWHRARAIKPYEVLRRRDPDLYLGDGNPRHRFESDQSFYRQQALAHVTFEVQPPPEIQVRDAEACWPDRLFVDQFDEPSLFRRLLGRWYRRRKADR